MAKVTSQLQVTVPKAIADAYGIRPGTELEWSAAGDAIRVIAAPSESDAAAVARRLAAFDEATARQAVRAAARPRPEAATGRGWTREDLYERGRTG